MVNKDKFGHEIYLKTFQKLLTQGRILVKLKYKESKRKPNLFYCKGHHFIFFADMRGTEKVPIWEDTSPLLYWNIISDRQIEQWEVGRIVMVEYNRLAQVGCTCRFSYEIYFSHEVNNSSLCIDEFGNIMDGYCHTCGKDIKINEFFCSNECEEKIELQYMKEEEERLRKEDEQLCKLAKETGRFCKVCGDCHNVIEHHTNYSEDEIILICTSCHQKIHKRDDYHSELKPLDSRKDLAKCKRITIPWEAGRERWDT